MPSHSETHDFPYSARQLFDMVADVERYPDFIPWCRAARILERHESYFLAELIISFNHLREQYTSKVHLHPPASEFGTAAIEVELVKGPFRHLQNNWRFEPIESGGTRVEFFIDFEFRGALLNKLIGGFFMKAVEKMVSAFSSRAIDLYGANTHS